MTPDSQQPNERLRDFCRGALGPLARTEFCGWDHAESRVWRVVAQGGRIAYLKQHRQARKFRQELHAYRHWLPQLPGRTPELLAVLTGEVNALLLGAVPGDLVEQLEGETTEVHDLYRQAGDFLRALHSLPFTDDDEVPLAEAVEQRLAAWTGERAEGVVDASERVWVRDRVTEALPLLEGRARVPCHRDYTARNWLTDEGALYVIDFEHARPDLGLLDLERLWSGVWPARPDLADAFWAGYGRHLTAEDEALLERLAALSALSTVVWAREHGDDAFEAYGWAGLERLKQSK